MKHPPYHLRANKAADRLILIETIARVTKAIGAHEAGYTYYGFGGPFLEDFKVIRKYFPSMRLVSVEKNLDTILRQRFHRFCRDIDLIHSPFDRFISHEFEPGERDIFWLDFTDMRPSYFGWIEHILPKLGAGSILKVTFPAQPPLRPDLFVNMTDESAEESKAVILDTFSRKYNRYLSGDYEKDLSDSKAYASRIVKMIRLAVGKAQLANGERAQLICAHRYADGLPMMSCAFSIANEADSKAIFGEMTGWGLSRAGLEEPQLLDLPLLSIQERLRLDAFLPQKSPTGKSLYRALGYKIEEDDELTIEKLRHYAEFQRYFPLFGKLEF